jgi:uncharacterized protein YqhQ
MSRTSYGGQAVVEGVMMRGPRTMAVAVRHPSGEIVLHEETLKGAIYTSRFAKLPLIRGAIAMWDTLGLGMRTLMFSANVAVAAEESGESGQPVKPMNAADVESAMPQGAMWGTLIVSLGLAVGLFFVLPVLAMGYLDRFITSSVVSNLVEKVIRLTLILGYIGGIGFLPDIKRVFAYHGAEHKAVNAHEAGAPLEVASVRRFTTIHPRCGTTFLIVVVVVSFVLFAFLGQPPLLLRVLSRIVLIPVVAGVAYEFTRFAANHYGNKIVHAIMAPGLAVQKLTTREPDDSQIETAIAALRAVITAENQRQASPLPVA